MSHFTWVDGSIVGLYLLATIVAGLMVRKYVWKVEHYFLAGREVDLYLGIASMAATEFGMVTCMYAAQNGYDKGFAGATPGVLFALAFLFVGKTGFCIKPLREAGVMTIPELFTKRFGTNIRRLSAVVLVLGGLLNMGLFLRTGGEFLVQVCGMNPGYLEITMTALMLTTMLYTILGGMLSVLITDYIQFIGVSIGLIIVTVMIIVRVGWGTLVHTVSTHYGIGGFNPFVNPTMGWPFVVFNGMLNLACVLTWQTIVQRMLAAKDVRTGQRVFTVTSFFFVCRFLIPAIWGIAALATLSPAVVGKSTLHAMPAFLSTFLPSGIMGIVIAGMLAADKSTDSGYMLTWASVIYNDIIAPFRRRPLSERKALFVNRSIVTLIGVFLLIYGLWYPLKGDLWTYLGITATIYLASLTTLLIACCYWKRANNWGAAGAIIFGALFPIAFLISQQLPATKALAANIGPYYSGIASYLVAGLAMVVGSLLKPTRRMK